MKYIILKESFLPEGKKQEAYSSVWWALDSENLTRIYRTVLRQPIGKPFTFNNLIFTKLPLNHFTHE
jgi:hypothetical protein